MGQIRKKSLVELVQDRVNKNTDTSAYKMVDTTPKVNSKNTAVKTQVDSLYKKNNNQNTQTTSTWENVQARVQNSIFRDIRNVNTNNNAFVRNKMNTGKSLENIYNRVIEKNESTEANVKPNKTNSVLSNIINKQNEEKSKLEKSKNELLPISKNLRENTLPEKISNPLLYKRAGVTITNEEANRISQLDSKSRFEEIAKYSNNEDERKANTSLVNQHLISNKAKSEAEKDNEIAKNGNLLEKAGVYSKVAGKELATGAINYFGDVSSMAYNLPTKVANLAGIQSVQQKNNKIISPEDFTNTYKQLKSGTEQYTSQLEGALGTTGRVANTIGNMAPAIVVGQTLGTTQKAAEAISRFSNALYSGASTYNDTLNEEQTNVLKSALKGTLYAIATYKIEGITGGNIINTNGSLDNLAINQIKKIKSRVGQKIFSAIYDVGGEIAEENLENWLDHLIDFAFGDADDISVKSLVEEFKSTTKDTTITNLVMQALGLGGGTYNDVQQSQVIDGIKNNNNLSTNQKENLIEMIDNNEINYPEAMYLAEKSKSNLTSQQLDIAEKFFEENNVLQENQEKLLNNVENKVQNEYKQVEKMVKNSNLEKDIQNKLLDVSKRHNLSVKEVDSLINNTKNGKIEQNQQMTIENKDLLNNNQQVTQVQNKIAQNEVSEQIKKDSENFAKQVDIAQKGMFPQRDMLTLLSKTPQALKDIGLPDLPITMTQKHLKTIMNESGQYKNVNYHNLGEDIIKQLPEAIANPLDIVQSRTKENSIVLTTYLADKQDRTIVASIQIDGKGQINDIEIDTNVMTSAYGRNNYEKFMEDNIRDGNLLYDIDRGVIKKATMAKLQLPRYSDSSVDTVDDVSTTNNIIAQNEKNMQVQPENILEKTKKQINKYKEKTNITNEEKSAIKELTVLNMQERRDFEKIKLVDTKNLLDNLQNIGSRIDIETETLIDDIKESGIKKPIEVSSETGKVVNGAHRLLIANQLGLDEVPVIYVESSNDISRIDLNENDWYNAIKERVDINEGKTTDVVARNRNERINNNRSNGIGNNTGISGKNDRVYRGKQKDNNRSSTETIYGTSVDSGIRIINEELENKSSSFSMEESIDTDLRAFQRETDRLYKEGKQRSYPETVINNVENTGNNVYNSNESESGIDGKQQERLKSNDRRRVQGLFELYQRGERYGSTDSEKLYGIKREEEITGRKVKEELINFAEKYQKTELSTEEQKCKNVIEKLGGNLVIYEYGEDNTFLGLSNQNNKTVYIDAHGGENIDNLFYHELIHYLRQNDNEIYIKEIKPIVNEIASDYEYQEAIFNYAMSSKADFDINNLDGSKQDILAEEVVADTSASLYGDLEADYGLPGYMIQRIKTSIDKILVDSNKNITNEVYREEIGDGKTRKHYKSVFESEQVGGLGKKAAKELYKTDTYTPISNLETITQASDNISRNGEENTYIAFRNKLRTNEKVTLQDIATGETLIQIYSQKGDYAKVNDLIQDVAILGTELGQQVQAFRLIKKASPEGQLQYLNKLVERTNLKEKANLKVTDEMAEKILKSKNQEELDNNLTEIAVELGSQLPITAKDKIRSWRYLCMLGNPKTHIKNLGANVFMNLTQNLKNKVAGGIEDVTGAINTNLERTKTLKFANKEQKNFAKQDAEYMKDLIDSGGKYDIKSAIQNNKKQFDNKVLNKIAEFNSNALDLEDKIFLKLAYQQSLQNYMAANKLKASDMEGVTLEKARQYSSIQAQEATFHQFNALANNLNEIENRGGLGGKFFEAIIPFKKTPLNIAKSGIEYSPIGLAKSLTSDIGKIIKGTKEYSQQLSEGKITQEQYKAETSKLVTKQIDNMSKGLTGTAIGVLGYFLASAGIIKAGNEGEDDEFEEKLGDQEYSIKIGDNTHTLDWISPSAIPLFTGATVYQLAKGEPKDKEGLLNSSMTGLAKAFEPMTEMSMLQGITSAISSYDQDSSSMIFDVIASGTTSYLGQFVPTALGQVARTVDPYERDTSTTKQGIEGKVDKFAKQNMNKIPGASFMLPVKKDVWGQDKKRNENVLLRGLENAILPFNRKELIEDRTNKELLNVFESSGEKVLPGVPDKDLTINKEKYRLTVKEYNTAKQTFGTTSKSLLDKLFKSKSYISLRPDGRAKAIQDVYSYAKEKIKVDYAKSINQKVETSKMYNTVSKLEKQKGNVSAYFEFKGKIEDLDRQKGDDERVKQKEKIKYLSEMNIDDKTKRIIYEDSLASEDEVEKIKDISITNYLEYKNNLSLATDKKRIEKKDDNIELNTTEKVNLIKDKNYSNNDKKLIYENFIGTNDNTYKTLSKLTSNLNINQYLDYRTSEFKADDDPNSDIVGKTISGSKKEKFENYINSSKFNTVERLYIYGKEYELSNYQKQLFLQYVDNAGIKGEERIELLSKMKGVTKYEDGRLEW